GRVRARSRLRPGAGLAPALCQRPHRHHRPGAGPAQATGARRGGAVDGAAQHSLAELAERFGLRLHGDGSVPVRGVATLQRAGPGELGFLANPRYRRDLADTKAAAVVLREADLDAS